MDETTVPGSVQHIRTPCVFKNTVQHWAASKWTPEVLADILKTTELVFRLGPQDWYKHGVLFEGDCHYHTSSLSDMLEWDAGSSDTTFTGYKPETSWCYLDYRHMKALFEDQPDILAAVDWGCYGLPGRDGRESTLWVGTAGAHTPCHSDTYGYNLVAQIYGRKKWLLFSPEDSTCLYPTRIPYEESSVFSQVNVKSPDFNKYPNFKNAKPVEFTLEPGDVLYVPKQWWHFVESLDTTISINSWIELPEDDTTRVSEAITRILVMSLMSEQPLCDWLNPTQEASCMEDNLSLLSSALRNVSTRLDQADTEPDNKRTKFEAGNGASETTSGIKDGRGSLGQCHLCSCCGRELGSSELEVPKYGDGNQCQQCEGVDLGQSATVIESSSLEHGDRKNTSVRDINLKDFVSCLTCPEMVALLAEKLEDVTDRKL